MKVSYTLMDVFTRERLSGNPLAVARHADGLLDDQMQRIARELNLSETVFVQSPKTETHTASVRIFTPRSELSFAGHPTVGVAVALSLDIGVPVVRLEEKVGLITCVIDKIDKRTAHARFTLPHLPEVAGQAPDKKTLALVLGLDMEEIGCGRFQPSVHTAGTVFYLVPVRNAQSLKRITPVLPAWADLFPLGHHSVYAYTATPEERDNNFAARMFSPDMPSGEDPATGSAAAALIGPLAEDANSGQTNYVIRQGVEMGRPSRILVQLRKDGDTLVHGGIGGDAVILGQGTLDLDD